MSEWARKDVLVVDDEQDICFLLENILRKRNLMPDCAYNLADASLWIEKRQPYLIFLDNSLPDGRGIDFIPYLKIHCPHSKIVVVTANDSLSDQYDAYSHGADDFLSKPLSLERINKTLDKMMFSPQDSPAM
ncbi:MAG: response regulator [Chitinophagales bacterium]